MNYFCESIFVLVCLIKSINSVQLNSLFSLETLDPAATMKISKVSQVKFFFTEEPYYFIKSQIDYSFASNI